MPHLVRLRFVKIPYGILIPFVMSILMGETQMNAAHSAPISNLLISEVYYDTPGVDADEEWIELVNIGEVEINLSSYKIGDEELWGGGEGMMRFPEGATLQAGDTVIIAQTSRGFSAIFGRKPDFEFQNTEPDVPDMQPYRFWASGDIRLSNDGDEVLILDSANAKVDLVAYGDSDVNQDGIYEGTPVGGVFRGQSIERAPVNCDTNTSADWQPSRTPAPWEISFSGYCLLDTDDHTGQLLPIGAIQGRQDVASHVNQTVSFRGVVTGFLEDQNERGAIFHTIYVQDLPGHEDGDPHTSDGIAIFAGTTRPDIELGDIVTVTGMVTEFYGLTEIDDHNLSIEVESRGDLMPEPVEINPPPARDDADSYLEKFEGMLVELPQSVVVGPTHEGCGFAVVPAVSGLVHIHHELDRQRLGFVVNVLHPSDVNCADIPSLNVGDVVNGLFGPLTYHFDRYKLVYQRAEDLEISPKDLGIIWQPPSLVEGQYSIASFNLNDYFGGDGQADIGSSASFRQDQISIKRDKYIHVIGQILSCPSILAVQEVENADLLHDLAGELDGVCGFTYQDG